MYELNRHFSVNQRAAPDDSVSLLMILMHTLTPPPFW